LVAVAISRIGEIGIDAERVDWQFDFQPIVDTVFAASERLDIRQTRGQDASARFYELWTLKESYLKARGAALGSMDLSMFAFDRVDGNISLKCSPEFDRPGDRWQFCVRWLRRDLVMSLAVGVPHVLQVGCRRWEPASDLHGNATQHT
jgi:4'-phosphopantetheinyl transferase